MEYLNLFPKHKPLKTHFFIVMNVSKRWITSQGTEGQEFDIS